MLTRTIGFRHHLKEIVNDVSLGRQETLAIHWYIDVLLSIRQRFQLHLQGAFGLVISPERARGSRTVDRSIPCSRR